MPRAIWSGAVSFGLVNVPVKAYPAVRDHSVHFHQLEKGTGARIRYRKVSDKTNKEVDANEIESGYELSPGRFVIVDPEEIDSLRPRTTRTIDIKDFVDLANVDPVYYERSYWLSPGGESAQRPYGLLVAAMEDENRVGIGTVVIRNKQYLAAIRPLEGALVLSTMRFADEVVGRSEVDELPGRRSKPDSKELKLAVQIVDTLSTKWDPRRYHDTYTEELKTLIEQKAKGKELTVEESAPSEAKVVNLLEALEASLSGAKSGGKRTNSPPARRGRTGGKTSTAKKASAAKSGSSRATGRSTGRRPARKSA